MKKGKKIKIFKIQLGFLVQSSNRLCNSISTNPTNEHKIYVYVYVYACVLWLNTFIIKCSSSSGGRDRAFGGSATAGILGSEIVGGDEVAEARGGHDGGGCSDGPYGIVWGAPWSEVGEWKDRWEVEGLERERVRRREGEKMIDFVEHPVDIHFYSFWEKFWSVRP